MNNNITYKMINDNKGLNCKNYYLRPYSTVFCGRGELN